nr:ATP dependent clp protease proteolytic subunit [Cordia dichotoma]
MPIGVPKVPFHIPGDEDASWVDLYNRLYRQRLLFLCQEVDSEIANQLVGMMVYLNIEDSTKDQYLFINSPGGWIMPGLAIYDIMQSVGPDVITVCIGVAASMGSFVLTGGAPTRRIAFPHARVMVHQPAGALFEGQTIDFVDEAQEILKLRDNLASIYVQRTGQPLWVITQDMERDRFMSATETKEYGIVDIILAEEYEADEKYEDKVEQEEFEEE